MQFNTPEDLTDNSLDAFLEGLAARTAMHNLLWFNEAAKHLSYDEAVTLDSEVHRRLTPITRARLYRFFHSIGHQEIPGNWEALAQEEKLVLSNEISKNWLAQDGIWFQAAERAHSMQIAKAVNDAAWAKFSPLEAGSIRRLLGLSDRPGLPGLARALHFRLYARINVQKVYTRDNAVILEMNRCRVQAARVRKCMEDYPCRSAGVVEYSTFASAIDPRITTTCIACPPDSHPAEWFCSWKFEINQS